MSGFVLNLDLTDYFEDMRKRACIFVDLSKCKDVGDVEKHIKSVFQLTSNTCLTYKQFLMPSCEDIQILKQFEIIKVQKRDFFDHQIHQNKQKASCEQPALNLVQSEKTIDLACRPKQRLNIDVCKGDRIFGSSKSILDESCKIQCLKKQKNKKKKHNSQDYDEEVNSGFETSGDILDMSVKKCRRKGNLNCFSTGEELKPNVNTDSHVSQNGNCFEIEQETLETQCQRKLKKRKKQSDQMTENFENDDSHVFKDNFVSKKLKKARKAIKYTENLNVSQENENGSKCMQNSTVGVNMSVNGCSNDKGGLVSELTLNHYCEEYDRILNRGVERFCSGVKSGGEEDHLTNKLTDSNDIHNSVELNNQIVETITNSCADKSFSEEQDEKSYSQLLNVQLKRKNRVRKHNRKLKRQNKELLLAVGPVLNGLKSKAQSFSSTAVLPVSKHTFFSDEDFAEEIKNPVNLSEKIFLPTDVLNPVVNQGLIESVNQTPTQVPDIQGIPTAWQQELLKLASCSSPVIIHRKTLASYEKTDPSSDSSKNITSETVKCDLPVAEGIISETRNETPDNNVKDFRSSSSDIKSVNNTVEGDTVNTMSLNSKLLPDAAKPLPVVDVENINLTNYPIINKVITGDLILFKVLKLNENSQPDVSKAILGKVMSTSLPDKVSFLLIEGCEECEPVEGADEGSDNSIREFCWRDILEPRLFYP